MTFWSWALEAYARPGVEAACLELQDHHRQCVPYLLWAAWGAADGRVLDRPLLERGAALALRWENEAVAPLRLVRRGLAGASAADLGPDREALRAGVKALELRAEEMAMRALEAITPPAGTDALPLAPALAAATAAWAFPAPRAALRPLTHALGRS